MSKCRLGKNKNCWMLVENQRIGFIPKLCEACYQEYKRKRVNNGEM